MMPRRNPAIRYRAAVEAVLMQPSYRAAAGGMMSISSRNTCLFTERASGIPEVEDRLPIAVAEMEPNSRRKMILVNRNQSVYYEKAAVHALEDHYVVALVP